MLLLFTKYLLPKFSIAYNSALHGIFFNSQTGLKMVNFRAIFVISVGISQTGKVLPKPMLGLIKPNITPRMGLYRPNIIPIMGLY